MWCNGATPGECATQTVYNGNSWASDNNINYGNGLKMKQFNVEICVKNSAWLSICHLLSRFFICSCTMCSHSFLCRDAMDRRRKKSLTHKAFPYSWWARVSRRIHSDFILLWRSRELFLRGKNKLLILHATFFLHNFFLSFCWTISYIFIGWMVLPELCDLVLGRVNLKVSWKLFSRVSRTLKLCRTFNLATLKIFPSIWQLIFFIRILM